MDQTADGREGRTARRGRNRQRLNRTEAQLRAAAAFMFTLVSSTTFLKTPARDRTRANRNIPLRHQFKIFSGYSDCPNVDDGQR